MSTSNASPIINNSELAEVISDMRIEVFHCADPEKNVQLSDYSVQINKFTLDSTTNNALVIEGITIPHPELAAGVQIERIDLDWDPIDNGSSVFLDSVKKINNNTTVRVCIELTKSNSNTIDYSDVKLYPSVATVVLIPTDAVIRQTAEIKVDSRCVVAMQDNNISIEVAPEYIKTDTLKTPSGIKTINGVQPSGGNIFIDGDISVRAGE